MATNYLGPRSATRDGSILVSQNVILVENVVVEICDTEGNLRGSLGTHEAREPTTLVGNTNYSTTFGRTLALEPWGELIVISPTDRYEFKAFAQGGTLARIVRRSHEPRSPADAHLQEYEAPGEEWPGVLWTVFDPDGRVLGFVETPEELEIYEIGADYIVGKAEDEEFGVESVQVGRLERSGG